MITFENSELENSVKEGLSCFAVPCEVFVPHKGEPVITTYSFCSDVASEWARIFSEDLLSEESIAWAEKNFETVVKDIGYVRFNNENEHMLEYIFTPDMQLPKLDITEKVHMISSNAVLFELCRMSGCDIEIADDGVDVVFAIIDNGKILSYAGMNDIAYEDGSVEISVETAPYARRKGFGILCVDALVKHLVSRGVTVRYKCAKDNRASLALCEKYGFLLEGERFSLVFERI